MTTSLLGEVTNDKIQSVPTFEVTHLETDLNGEVETIPTSTLPLVAVELDSKEPTFAANSSGPIDETNPEPIDEKLSNLEVSDEPVDGLKSDQIDVDPTIELNDFFPDNPEPVADNPSLLDPQIASHPDDQDSKISTDEKSHEEGSLQDTQMTDALLPPTPPQVSSKVSREREDDDAVEPSAKRPKIDDSASSCPPAPKEEQSSINSSITAFQTKELIKILRNIARTNAGKNFRQPVAVLWPTIADNYAAKIPHPMDLSTIEKKLKEEAYSSISDIKADVHLIYNNSVIFNSAENPVSKCAMETRNALLNKFSTIPAEPTPVPKKEKKVVKRSTAGSENPARSSNSKRNAHPALANSASQISSQAFALDPTTNTPLIRRDSSKGDGGRPKREIHPPKNKDLSYAIRPKNKKHLAELKFCEDVLSELQKPKYNSFSHPFMIPVDPVALGIPNYFAVIKKPMDISTVTKKLKDGAYLNSHEFEKDIRQIFINCYKFNPEGNPVRQMGQSLEEIFNNYWAKREQYLNDHSPSAASPSDKDSEDEESDEDEGMDGAAVAASLMSQKERLLEEQSKLISMMGAKHKDEGLLQMQTDLVELIQRRVKAAEEQAKKTMNKKKVTKVSKKSVPAKKSAPVRKVGAKKKFLGTLEKETISAGLGLLPPQIMASVVEMIKMERPELADAGDETMELDIDSISESVLWQIHVLIMKHVPELEGQIKEAMSSEPRPALRTAKPATKKKNKPMSKHEQERKIEALTNLDSQFSRVGFSSQEPLNPGVANYASSPQQDASPALDPESSGDEDSDSEEE